MVEQGFTFTVVASRHFLDFPDSEAYAPEDAFLSARRIWLPAVPGVDWLHDGAAHATGPTGMHFAIESHRETVEIGAGGGSVEVLLFLYILAEHTEVGRRLQADLYEWVKRRATERREETGYETADPAPDFSEYELNHLATGMKGELADLAKVPESRLRLVSAERVENDVVHALYRDEKTGAEYETEIGRDYATFSRRRPH